MTRQLPDRPFAAFVTTRTTRIGAVVAAGIILLAGCSSSADATGTAVAAAGTASSTSSGSATTQSGSGSAGSGSAGSGGTGSSTAGGGQRQQTPSASGTIAALTGTTLQVQGADSQTAVTFGDSTTITTTVAAALTDVAVGSCVLATAESATSGSATAPGSATTQSPALATGGATDTGPLTAARVVISDAVDGACTQTGGMGGGMGFGAPGGAAPTDGAFPTDGAMPTDGSFPAGGAGMGSGAGGFGNVVFGLVSAVDGDTVTVTTAGQSAGTRTVTVTDTTTYTKTVAGDASALVVGQCARAVGTEDTSGAIAATTIAVSAPSATGCSTATGRGGRMGGNRSGTTTSSSANG